MKNAWIGIGAGFIAVVLCFVGPAVAEPLSVGNLPTAEETTPAPADKYPEIGDAVAKFNVGDVTGALDSLRQAVKAHPELPPAQVIMAQLYMRAQQGQLAQEALQKATQEVPGDPEAYIMLGQGALQANRLTEAESVLRKADSLLKDFKGTEERKTNLSVVTYSLLAQLDMNQKNFAGAQAQLAELLKMKPDSSRARVLLARALFEQDKFQEATDELKKAAGEDEGILTPDAILATWYEEKGDRKKAAEYMVAALEAKPKDINTRIAAAQWAFTTKQLDQAAQQAEIARQLDPDSLAAKIISGNIAIFQKDYAAAEKFLTDAHLQSPSNFTATNNLALALAEQEEEIKKRQAVEYANINVRLYPKQTEPWSTLGWALYRLGQIDEAERALRQAAQFKRLSPDTAYYIARVDADRGRKDEAITILEKALQSESASFSKRAEAEALLAELKKEGAEPKKEGQ